MVLYWIAARYCDKSLRLQFERGFDFVRYNRLLIRSKCGKELIAAFDPSFVPLLEAGLHVITKMRPDANLRYLYTGGKKKGRGRPKVLDGKVNCKQIDKRRFKEFFRDKHTVCYSAKVYCVILKKMVRIVYIQDIKTLRYELLMCTDTGLSPQKILDYYRLRFQIEFLFRDAKQYAGLEDCQARSYKKLSFHFNMALSAVSTAKDAVWLSVSQQINRRPNFFKLRS